MKSKLEVLSTARDLRLDSLRGLFIVFMTINHLPTSLRVLTDESIGIFTAAEGFVFLSGLLAGMVYTRKFRMRGAAGLRAASLARAQTIYWWHLAAFAAAFALVRLSGLFSGVCSWTAPQLFYENPLLALGLGACLLHQPGLLDLLPMYCLFVLLIPAVVRPLEAGKGAWVLAISGLIWLASQWSPPIDGAPLYPINVGTFNLFAWQFLFVLGIVLGHAQASGRAQVARPNPAMLVLAATVAVYGWGLHHLHWYRIWPDRIFGIFLNKPALGLFRLADFGCVAFLVAALGARFPRLITWKPLAFLGQHSLQVVAAQSVIVMALLQFPRLFATEFDRTLTAAAAIGLLFAAAAAHRAHQLLRPAASAVVPIGSRQAAGLSLDSPHDIRAA
jgi:hypothetical protein